MNSAKSTQKINSAKHLRKMKDYYPLDEWLSVLQSLEGFSLRGIDFKPNSPNLVKQIRGTVLEEKEKYIGTMMVKEKHQINVHWRHTGFCYRGSGQERLEQFDVCNKLQGLC